MKVLYVGRFTKYWNTENYVAWAIRDHNVEVVEAPCDMNVSYLQTLTLRENPDVVLLSKASPSSLAIFIRWCKSQHILVVSWIWDLYWGYRSARPVQFKADLLFTTDGGHNKQFRDFGCNHRVLRQGIHQPEHQMFEANYSRDLAFVGGPPEYRGEGRKRLLNWLKSTFKGRITHYQHTRGLALNKLLAQTKIVVGDSYPSPHYWSNRIYEILGRGGFLLHPKTEGMDTEFVDGVHYVSYKRENFEDLRDKIGYWLLHDQEREAIRIQGFQHCGERHTYTHRVAILLNHITKVFNPHSKTAVAPH